MNRPKNFYHTGGDLPLDSPSYVERQADKELYDALRRGDYCCVLTSRQMGKSSLMRRVSERLRNGGASVAVIVLTGIGKNLTVEQWYDAILEEIGQELKLAEEVEKFWLANSRLSPLRRLMKAIREVVLPNCTGQIVIFIDEVDGVLGLPFSADEFFAAIRNCYNRRDQDTEYQRLVFCLLGVVTPSELIRDPKAAPFNIGLQIDLTDFTVAEASDTLAVGLERRDKKAVRLLKHIHRWTNGQPYLTQRLCQAIREDPKVRGRFGVKRHCKKLFFYFGASNEERNLSEVQKRIVKDEKNRNGLLDLYEQVRRGQRVPNDERNPLVNFLWLAGIAVSVSGYLQVRNRIYRQVFDLKWVKEKMTKPERLRQQAAFRRGVIRVTAISLVVIVAISSLAVWAIRQKNQAERNRQIAEEVQSLSDNMLNAISNSASLAYKENLLNDLERIRQEAKATGNQNEEVASLNALSTIYIVRGNAPMPSLNTLSTINIFRGDAPMAYSYLKEAEKLLPRIGNSAIKARTYSNLGYVAYLMGESENSIKHLELSLMLWRSAGNRRGQADSLNRIGVAYRLQGQWENALRYFNQSLATYRELPDPRGEAEALSNIGVVYRLLGNNQTALVFFSQAKGKAGDRQIAATILAELGKTYYREQDSQNAMKNFEEALNDARYLGERYLEASILSDIGTLYMWTLDDPKRGLDYYFQAIKIWEELKNPRGEGNTRSTIGLAYSTQRNEDGAIQEYKKSLRLLRAGKDKVGEAFTISVLGDSHYKLFDYHKAIQCHGVALQLRQELGQRSSVANIYGKIGDDYQACAQNDDALKKYKQALQIYDGLGSLREPYDIMEEASINVRVGEVYEAMAENKLACTHYHRALQIYEASRQWQRESGKTDEAKARNRLAKLSC